MFFSFFVPFIFIGFIIFNNNYSTTCIN
jgi:hypothetical protein